MKKHHLSALCLTATVLVGCATIANVVTPAADPAPDQIDPTDPCGAQGYTSLVGSPLAAVTLPADLNDRVIQPGTVATTDFDPSRLNIELNEGGTIVGLSCG